MEDFADRERAFVDNMSATVTGVVVPILDADLNARVRNGENAIRLFNAGNVDVTTATTILGEPEPLVATVSLPKAMVTELGGMRMESADIEMTMDVSSSVEEHDLTKTEAAMEGTAEAAFGIFKIRTSFSAKASTESERTRKSDYRAKTSLRIHMQAAPAPEGVMLAQALPTDSRRARRWSGSKRPKISISRPKISAMVCRYCASVNRLMAMGPPSESGTESCLLQPVTSTPSSTATAAVGRNVKIPGRCIVMSFTQVSVMMFSGHTCSPGITVSQGVDRPLDSLAASASTSAGGSEEIAVAAVSFTFVWRHIDIVQRCPQAAFPSTQPLGVRAVRQASRSLAVITTSATADEHWQHHKTASESQGPVE